MIRRGGIIFGVLALAGCNGVLPGGTATPVPELALMGGAVTAKGPANYCVDSGVSRPARGFALIAACSTLKGEGPMPWRNAVIAVQVGAAGSAAVSGAEADMAAFLATPAGAAVLSRTGNPSAIAVRDSDAVGGGVVVAFTDTDPVPIPGTQQAEWRGFLDLNGRLVTVSLRGLADNPLTQDVGTSLLRDAMAVLRAANPSDA